MKVEVIVKMEIECIFVTLFYKYFNLKKSRLFFRLEYQTDRTTLNLSASLPFIVK